jgi:hypothetical protein
LRLEDNQPGLRVVISLPLSHAAPVLQAPTQLTRAPPELRRAS